MITIARGFAAGVVLAGTAVGLAVPASAEAPSGSYTATTIEGGMVMQPGSTMNWSLTPCGPDCTRIEPNPPNPKTFDLHPQGNSWTGVDGAGCAVTLDSTSLLVTEVCPVLGNLSFQLTKNG
jgi:hypothetical protein